MKLEIDMYHDILGACEDTNVLCEMEPSFILDILCQIETVKEQCPNRCNNCPETLGMKTHICTIKKYIFKNNLGSKVH